MEAKKRKASKQSKPRKSSKAVQKKKVSAASARPKSKKKRDFKAEYEKRKQRGIERGISLPAARGHARPGDVSPSDWKEIRRAAQSPYRRTHWRKVAAETVAGVARVEHNPPRASKMTRPEWEWLERARWHRNRFVATFLKLGLGNEHQAYSLWFSP